MAKTTVPQKRARQRPGMKLVIEVLMRGMTKEERTEVLTECGYTEDTWWGWCRVPTRIRADALVAIVAKLTAKHQKDFKIQDLYSPVA